MAVRQYIGARYVPAYYQNSLDPTSSEWEANVSYDPLTIVSLPNMHSYQSKKFVPASVGSPASNPEYWYDQGYASAYFQALQDQIDDMKDGTVAGSLQDQINGNTSDITALSNKAGLIITPEDYGAIGDGVSDDSQSILAAFNAAKTKKDATILLANKYNVATALTLDGADGGAYTAINILCTGVIIPTAKIKLQGITRSHIVIRLQNGGTNDANDNMVTIDRLQESHLELSASSVNATAFNIIGCNACRVSVCGNDNLRTLLHGGSTSYGYFGTYDNIFDASTHYPIKFYNSTDITIVHYEGIHNNPLQYCLEFDNCQAINILSLATGGKSKGVVKINDSYINIVYAFLTNEDTTNPRQIDALIIMGKTWLEVDSLRGGNFRRIIDAADLSNATSYKCGCRLSNYWLEPSDYGNTEIYHSDAIYRAFIKGVPVAVATPTPASGIDISYLTNIVIDDKLYFSGVIVTTTAIAAYTNILTNIAKHAISRVNGILQAYDGACYPIFVNRATKEITTQNALPSNTNFLINLEMDFSPLE